MLLAIDIGNTNIHFGLHEKGGWRSTWRARTIPGKMADEYAVLLRAFFLEYDLRFSDIDGAVIASVVPNLTQTFVELCERYLRQRPLVIDPERTPTGISLLVDNPREVGADRVVNAAAAHRLYGGPCIVLDFGTATTFDVLDAQGAYLGGVIAPGPNLALEALARGAAQLRKVEVAPPPAVIGRNTIHAMQSGLFLGYLSLIEGLVGRISAELGGGPVRVIATGGLAPLFAEHCPLIEATAPLLTLDGMQMIWEMNQGNRNQ